MRYKHPEADDSREVSTVLSADADGKPTSDDFRFAAAVAEWGLLLRGSQYKGSASFDGVLTRAGGAVANDPNGHRAEFLDLVRASRRLTNRDE